MFDVFYLDCKPNLFAFEQPAESIEQAAEQSRTEFFWYIHGRNDYTDFDFDWKPVPWEKDHVHVFPSQWQRNGDVYFGRKWTAKNREWHFRQEQSVKRLVDMAKWTVPEYCNTEGFDFSWHPDSTEPAYEYRFPTQHQREGGPIYNGSAGIKYCNSQRVRANATQIFYMDFLDPGSADRYQKLQALYPDIKRTRYVDNHLTVFKRIVNLATTEFVWIVSSICDYTDFDFTWHPDESQREMIHCFYSENQKRGDTFLIHVQSFKNQMYDLELLDWFNVINYIDSFRVPRIEMPVHYYEGDDLISEIKNYKFSAPYALFTNQPDVYTHWHACLWTEKDRVATAFSTSKSICAIPRDVKAHLRTQIYDYPHVEDRDIQFFAEEPLDIIYISNGEPDEEFYYNWLQSCVNPSRRYLVKWVRGVNGRTEAFRKAAEISTTPWFFKVPSKLKVDSNFDWRWQPDYWQQPKHYIFNARNPVNNLEYGHQAMVCFNKNLVLKTQEPGLDFTLSQEHEVVPILSGVANFNQTPFMTWRTAFREVIKLQQFQNKTPSVENKHRLKVWTTQAQGQYSEYCIKGAQDAVEYFNSVSADYEKLKLSYDWQWLEQYFDTVHPQRKLK